MAKKHKKKDVTPIHVPCSPPSAERPGDVTSGFDAPALAACPVCLERPSPEPDVHETAYLKKKTYPCCGAFTHLGCMVQAARLHGRCTNCRAAIDHLPREPSVAERCQDLGISLEFASARLPARSTAHAEVRDYATRTFSRVDAPEPSEPAHVRVVCCRRLAGPAMGFTEFPGSRMVPRRGPSDITRCLPVHDTVAAIAFVVQARGDDLSQSAAFQRLVAWAARSSGAESLSVILWAVAVPEEGH